MKSLLVRSMVAVVAVVLPLVFGTTLMVQTRLTKQVNNRFDGRLVTETHMLQTAVRHAERTQNQDGLMALAQLLPLDTVPGDKTFGIWVDGKLWMSDKKFPLHSLPARNGFENVDKDAMNWRVYAERATPDAVSTSTVVVAVAEQLPNRTNTVREVVVDVAWPLVGVIPLIVLGIYLALRRSLSPISTLAQQIGQRSAERRDPINNEHVPIEMTPIVESVNHLMSRVGESMEREQRFTADAAHELRTPMTALKAHAQVALQTTDDEQRRSTLRRIVATVNRTNRLISQLLTLAQLDPQAPHVYTDQVDVANVARQTIADLHTAAETRNQRLLLNAEPDVMIRSEPATLGLMMRNLVENAIHYSADSEPIEVRVYREGAATVFEVEDHGPGIPDAAKSEVFRRFWRIPGSTGFGTGLGMSIVQRVVELHGAQIALKDRCDGSGLCVAVSFPAS